MKIPAQTLHKSLFKSVTLAFVLLAIIILLKSHLFSHASWPQELTGFAVTPQPLQPLALQQSNGQTMHVKNFTGKWTLVFFGFTHCPDVCPSTLLQLSGLKKRLQKDGMAHKYQFLFVSVDPQRDSAEHLHKYVRYFDADFMAATGSSDNIRAFEQQFSAFHRLEKKTPQDQHYNVAHSAEIFIIDPQARYVGKFTPPFDIYAVVNKLDALNDFIFAGEGKA